MTSCSSHGCAWYSAMLRRATASSDSRHVACGWWTVTASDSTRSTITSSSSALPLTASRTTDASIASRSATRAVVSVASPPSSASVMAARTMSSTSVGASQTSVMLRARSPRPVYSDVARPKRSCSRCTWSTSSGGPCTSKSQPHITIHVAIHSIESPLNTTRQDRASSGSTVPSSRTQRLMSFAGACAVTSAS